MSNIAQPIGENMDMATMTVEQLEKELHYTETILKCLGFMAELGASALLCIPSDSIRSVDVGVWQSIDHHDRKRDALTNVLTNRERT